MDLSLLNTNTILLFLLILTRVIGMLTVAPFFNQQTIPLQVQIGLALALSIVLFPIYSVNGGVPASDLWQFAWSMGQEFAIGFIIGFAANLVFAAVQLAGSHVTMQMGISVAHAIDPNSGEQSPIMGQFYFILAIFLFLSLNIHHALIMAVAKSFEVIPPAGEFIAIGPLTGRFTSMASDLFTLSVMLIIPILGIMLVLEVAMAMIAKIMPQMNIFMVSMPLKIAVTLILIYATLPFTAKILSKAFYDLVRHLPVLYQS